MPDTAEPNPGQLAPNAFGIGTQLIEIHAPNWMPQLNTANPNYVSGTGYVAPAATATSYYWTQLNLPIGSTVTNAYAFVYDNDSSNWSFQITAYEAAVYSTSPSVISMSSINSTSGTPGYTYITSSFTPFVIRGFVDLSGDSVANEVTYTLQLWCGAPSSTTNLRFWGSEVKWTRTISPAPGTATFNDVQPGDFGFQQVEALAASGITAGCGGGNFCPNAPLTRVQMAVFLAKALGLHWSS
ncbi:MAG: S-layer homology domain-containing protein [Acidobacteria bacterium]|nr:S-layer homology domain-containing protein [Acidobacteriota bacterium]